MGGRLNEADVTRRLHQVAAAEDRLSRTLDGLDETALRGRSLLPGWTRGHVLAHVALNAHSLVNLFDWARTGVETPQYPSWEKRDADIEEHAGRSPDEHRTALEDAAEAFRAAALSVPADRWDRPVSGIGGDPTPAASFLFGRLREVEIHHVDLDAGYGPGDWDEAFVRAVLEQVPARLTPHADEAFVARATDLGIAIEVGSGSGAEVSGPAREMLAWLLGRTDGSALDVQGGSLPGVPSWG